MRLASISGATNSSSRSDDAAESGYYAVRAALATTVGEAARHLAEKGTKLLIRVPLIPGFTDDEENIRGIAKFVASLGREIPVELLNFNPMCREKYESMRETYQFDPDQREIPQERVDALKQILRDHGLIAV